MPRSDPLGDPFQLYPPYPPESDPRPGGPASSAAQGPTPSPPTPGAPQPGAQGSPDRDGDHVEWREALSTSH